MAEVLLESHENGPPSFLGGNAGAGRVDFAAAGGAGGGGANGTEGRVPERPCISGGGFSGRAGGLITLSLEVMVVERERDEVASCEFSSWTSSIDDVESRRPFSRGDFFELA